MPLDLQELFRLLRMVVGAAETSHSGVSPPPPLAAHKAEQTTVLTRCTFGRLQLGLGGGIGRVHETPC